MFYAGFVMAPFSMTIFVPLHMVATGRGKFKKKMFSMSGNFTLTQGKLRLLRDLSEISRGGGGVETEGGHNFLSLRKGGGS